MIQFCSRISWQHTTYTENVRSFRAIIDRFPTPLDYKDYSRTLKNYHRKLEVHSIYCCIYWQCINERTAGRILSNREISTDFMLKSWITLKFNTHSFYLLLHGVITSSTYLFYNIIYILICPVSVGWSKAPPPRMAGLQFHSALASTVMVRNAGKYHPTPSKGPHFAHWCFTNSLAQAPPLDIHIVLLCFG